MFQTGERMGLVLSLFFAVGVSVGYADEVTVAPGAGRVRDDQNGPVTDKPDGPVPLRERPPLQPPAKVLPVAEARFDWRLERLGAPANAPEAQRFGHRFTVPLVELGLVAEPDTWVAARATVELLEFHPETDAEGVVPDSNGWSVGVRDVFVDMFVNRAEGRFVRVGVQPTIVGARGWFNLSEHAYYLVGPRVAEVSVLSGDVYARDIGIRLRDTAFQDRLVTDVMVANGTGSMGSGEENKDKAGSVRIDVAPIERLHLIASGESRLDGTNARNAHQVFSFIAEARLEQWRVMGEFLAGNRRYTVSDTERNWGVQQPRFSPGDSVSFIGGQGGGALSLPVGKGRLDSVAITSRLGFFDPVAEALDAGAWLIADGSVQTWWKVKGGFRLMNGVGYGMYMPMDVTEIVQHTVVFQTLWKL
jgi:hypothetical protein